MYSDNDEYTLPSNDGSINSIRSENSSLNSNVNLLEDDDILEQIVPEILIDIFYQTEGWWDRDDDTLELCLKSNWHNNLNQKLLPINDDYLDRRLKHWRNYLDIQKKLCKKIIKLTGKEKNELLLLSSDKYRQKEFIKKFINHAIKLNSLNLTKCNRIEGKAAKYIENSWKILAECDLDKFLEKIFMVGMPIITKIEQDLDTTEYSKKNKDMKKLEKTFKKYNSYTENILHFPETKELQIVGRRIRHAHENYQTKQLKTTDKFVPKLMLRSIETICKSKTDINEEYTCAMKCNDIFIDINSKKSYDLIINLLFKSKLYKKQNKIFTLENCGRKIILFEWKHNRTVDNLPNFIRKKKSNNKTINPESENSKPMFYFNHNKIKLRPGKILQVNVTFCCSKSGIHEEQWHLYTEPNFFLRNKKIIINLFGYGYENSESYNSIVLQELENDIKLKSYKNLCSELINSTMKQLFLSIGDEKYKILPSQFISELPYFYNFTDKEIFLTKNSSYGYTENYMNDLKCIYDEVRYELSSSATSEYYNICPKWNHDLLDLRDLILKINDTNIRKKLFYKFIEIVYLMKREITLIPLSSSLSNNTDLKQFDLHNNKNIHIVANEMYENHKYLLVRSVIISLVQLIDEIGCKFREFPSRIKQKFEYDEMIIERKYDKHNEEDFNHDNDEIEKKFLNKNNGYKNQWGMYIDAELQPHWNVIKTKSIRDKQNKMFQNAFYICVYSNLSQAIQDISGILEESKHLY